MDHFWVVEWDDDVLECEFCGVKYFNRDRECKND